MPLYHFDCCFDTNTAQPTYILHLQVRALSASKILSYTLCVTLYAQAKHMYSVKIRDLFF